MTVDLTAKVCAAITKYDMIAYGSSVLVGVSGGADSVALLHVLLGLGYKATALHLNHGLRGGESDADESFVSKLCERLGVPCVTERADLNVPGLSVEEAGRKARYAFFERERRKAGDGAVIAVAHTLNDSLETVLLNLARGTALRGLCGIPPVRDNIIRPLIECERQEIEAFLKENNLAYVHDGSNDGDGYARNRLRHHAMPALKSVNAAYLRAALRTTEALRADADYLDRLAEEAMPVTRGSYRQLAAPIRMRVLLLMLKKHGVAADSDRLSRLDRLCATGGAEQLTPALSFVSGKNSLGIVETVAKTPVLKKNLSLVYENYENYEESIKSQPKLLNNAIDCDKIDGILVERRKQPKDRLRPVGRGCTKTLKNLCQEAGIPPDGREELIILADSKGPVWVQGFGADERAAPGPGTRRVVVARVTEET